MCDFSENNVICNKKICHGQYCNKHKRNYLVHNDFIVYDRFTNKPSDYLKDDILRTINKYDNKKYHKSLKKNVLFELLSERYNKIDHYNDNIDIIKSIQSKYKAKYNRLNEIIRGEGFNDRKKCNNNEDFFTYETYDEIDDRYFFSYKDDTDIVWFFDIRSLKKLIDMNQGNPYTMKEFDYPTIYKANKLIEYLKNNNVCIDFKDEMKELKKDKRKILKQKMIDIFSSIERLGYSFNNDWFTILPVQHLKKLYSLLEDIWNYRAQLPMQQKMLICPPNGMIFNKHPIEIRNITNKHKMREIIIEDISKFNNAVSDNDKKTGFMYFLIALGKINPSVTAIHPWIAYV